MRRHFDVGEITIVKARASDLASVMEILDEAAEWLEARGVQQWPSPHPPHFWKRTEGAIHRGEVYLATCSPGQPAIGTLRLTWTDAYWSHVPESALYVHGLAIRTEFHGRLLGVALLKWAIDQARHAGRTAIRLDCSAQNVALCHYYEALGFRCCGQIEDRDYQAKLYELVL